MTHLQYGMWGGKNTIASKRNHSEEEEEEEEECRSPIHQQTNKGGNIGSPENEYQKGVIHLCQNGITGSIPNQYILPISERPGTEDQQNNITNLQLVDHLNLPLIDFTQLQGPERPHVLELLAKACEEYGFFQVINHGIPSEVLTNLMDASRQFFELSFEEKSKYMSTDMYAPVRYGTSFNQKKDEVFCWRDFLKLTCHHPVSDVDLLSWPSSPVELRPALVTHLKQTQNLFLKLTEAILESLGLVGNSTNDENDSHILNEFENGGHLIVINCYPSCPEPSLTLGIPPHSDYGFLTLLLQDNAEGLQIQHTEKWVTVKPLPNSFVVNIGDHLEIFSNGRYKSVLHRAVVNSSRTRMSIASFHTMPLNSIISPSPKLIDESNPRRYKDTDFASFLEYTSSREPKKKGFLESRKLT